MNTLKARTPNFIEQLYSRSRSRLKTLIAPRVAVCRVRNVTIRIGVSSEIEQYRVETYGTKEPETLDWLDQNLREGDVFIDVGANIGLYSLYAAKIKPTCQVFAFEPAFHNFARLCNNIVLNDTQIVIPCNLSLADRESFDYFYVSDPQPGSAFNSFGPPSDLYAQSKNISLRQAAFSFTLDALVTKHNLPPPAMIKIDVDGIEEKILEGAQAVLQSSQTRSLLIEWSARNEEDIARLKQRLGNWGLVLSGISSWVVEQDRITGRNFIFHRK